jgi:poly-gamma-glutamate synthesis protein (capsule biosynthesis protein)
MSSRQWKVVIAGECMVSRPFSMHDDPEFTGVIDLLRDSDFTYAHLEMNLGEFEELDWPARGDWIGSYMISDPKIAADLKWAGIDIMSLAHNHSLDFGAAGLLATIRHCKAAGLACAGTGRDLEEAREPAYLETNRGRVALISTSTGNKSNEWAGHPKAGLRGRPGINPLRANMKYVVDHAAAAQLRDIAKKLDVYKDGNEPGEFVITMPGDQSTRGSGAFVEGDTYAIRSACHARDLAGNLRSVDEAVTMADLVMVAHHFNISEGKRGDAAPSFAREFAHAAIDAGADIYLGHGWHRTLGIEIRNGKPIFYGLGNFFAQSEFIRRVPYDSYETWGHDVDRLPTLTPAAHPLHPGLDAASQVWWNSAVIVLTLDNGEAAEMKFYPVEMGRDAGDKAANITRRTGHGPHPLTEGRPRLAKDKNAELILGRIQKLSAQYGTKIAIENGVGVWRR